MQKIICLVSVILVSGFIGVDSLQCYVCFNCTTPTDADLMTCGDSETTITPPGTTVVPPQTTVVPPQTTVVPPQTTVVPPQTAPASTDTTPIPDPGPLELRSKRSVLWPLVKSHSDGHNCKNEAGCECDNVFSNHQISEYADEASYLCFKLIAKDNNADVIIRGCVPALIDGKAPCDSPSAANTESCHTCSTDKCNGSFTVQYSTFMLLATFGLKLFK